MNVYHYAKIDDWNGIKRGSWKSDDIPGLGTYQRLNPYPYFGSNIQCSFSLLEPQPSDWLQNKHFPYIWKDLKSITGPLLVEVNTNEVHDKVFVVDWAHVQGFATENQRRLPEKYRHKTEDEARKAYFKSMIHIDEFSKERSKLKYSLPEVIITEIVPFTSLRIPKIQQT